MYFYESLVEDKLVSISLWFYTYILLLLRKDMGNVCTQWWKKSYIYIYIYRGADKSSARPTFKCALYTSTYSNLYTAYLISIYPTICDCVFQIASSLRFFRRRFLYSANIYTQIEVRDKSRAFNVSKLYLMKGCTRS